MKTSDMRLRAGFSLSALVLAAAVLVTAGPAQAKPEWANETGAECAFCHDGPMANKMLTTQGTEFRQYLINQGRLPGCAMVDAYDANGNYLGKIQKCN